MDVDLKRIADAIASLEQVGDAAVAELSTLGAIASQLNLIKGELYEIAGNTKSIANSQRALASLLEDMSFSCQNKHHPTARYLRVFSDSE
jgi:hypothetical protein